MTGLRPHLRRVGTLPVLAFAAVICFTPLLARAVISIRGGTDSIRHQVDDRLSSSAILSGRFVGAQMLDALDVTSAFANGPALRSALADGGRSPDDFGVIRARLAQLHGAVSGSKAAVIVDPAGTITDLQPLDPGLVGKNFSHRDWYRGVIAGQAPYVSEAFVSAYVGNPLAVGVAAPVFGDGAAGQLLGILEVIYPMQAIQAFTDQFGSSSQLTLSVVDQHGHLLAGPGVGSSGLRSVGADPRVRAALRGGSGVGEVDSGRSRVLSAYSPIPKLGWVLLSQVDRDQALAGATRLQTSVVLLTGAVALVVVAGLAITAVNRGRRLRAERELREQVLQGRQLLDGLPVGIFVAGSDGRPTYANELSTEILGQGLDPDASPDQLGEVYHVYRAGTDDLYPADRIPLVRALAGEHVRLDDLEVARADARVAVEVWASPIYDEHGTQVSAVAALVDITERKRAQREILEFNSELEARVSSRTEELVASNEELEAFTYSVSHDLRTPLRAMAGFAAMLKEKTAGAPDPDVSRYAERIAVNAQKMGQLVDELLALSRLNRQDLKKVSFLPAETVRRALENLHDEVRKIHAEIEIADMPACNGDPGLVQQVYANLLSNALKYSRDQPNPVVQVGSTYDSGTGTVYYVRDNGAGFDMRFKDKLFGVFQRLHRADQFEGNGVGLAIVKRIVTRHGGQVFAEGSVNAGATFSFTLGRP